VTSRRYTGAGFLTDLDRSEALRLFDEEVSLRAGRVGARLNSNRLETGYLVYIDNGYLTTLEGYTFGVQNGQARDVPPIFSPPKMSEVAFSRTPPE
jgi:hypothetical protein